MNLVNNSCIGSYITQKISPDGFHNPFQWCQIDFDSMYYMIKNWSSINWFNYELIKDDKWNFSIIIDNHIKVNYIHYKFDKNALFPIVKGTEVFYCKIWEYIVEKYETRIKRMLKYNEEPIFILANIHDYEINYYTIEEQNKIIELNKYKTIIAFSKNTKMTSDNSEVINYNTVYKINGALPGEFILKHSKFLHHSK